MHEADMPTLQIAVTSREMKRLANLPASLAIAIQSNEAAEMHY